MPCGILIILRVDSTTSIKEVNMAVLTTENAKKAKIIRSLSNPEAGDKQFDYRGRNLGSGVFGGFYWEKTYLFGFSGSGDLWEDSYHLWEVVA